MTDTGFTVAGLLGWTDENGKPLDPNTPHEADPRPDPSDPNLLAMEQIAGKTIKAADTGYDKDGDPCVILAFADGTYCCISAGKVEYDDYIYIASGVPSDDTLAQVGIITEEECARRTEERSRKIQEENKQRRREEYEQLRQEFDPHREEREADIRRHAKMELPENYFEKGCAGHPDNEMGM
jgi:hypothetical protein